MNRRESGRESGTFTVLCVNRGVNRGHSRFFETIPTRLPATATLNVANHPFSFTHGPGWRNRRKSLSFVKSFSPAHLPFESRVFSKSKRGGRSCTCIIVSSTSSSAKGGPPVSIAYRMPPSPETSAAATLARPQPGHPADRVCRPSGGGGRDWTGAAHAGRRNSMAAYVDQSPVRPRCVAVPDRKGATKMRLGAGVEAGWGIAETVKLC
jgi:hypothetical protein